MFFKDKILLDYVLELIGSFRGQTLQLSDDTVLQFSDDTILAFEE